MGTSFVEIFQNCPVYNDGVFSDFTDREVAEEAQIHVENGQPLVFGKARDRGLRLRPGSLEIEAVRLGEDGLTEADLLVHDETSRPLAGLLADMALPALPRALGVLYCDPGPAFETQVRDQIRRAGPPRGSLDDLLRRGHTWTIEDEDGAS